MIAVFLVVTLIQGLVALYNFRAGFLLFVLMFSIYPRFLAVGVSEYGFALTAQRVMIATLLILFVLRWLHGTADIARGIDIFRKNRVITILLLGIPVSKLVGNWVAGRMDIEALATFASDVLFSFFIVVLVVICVSSWRHIYVVLTLVVLSLFINQFAAIAEFVKGSSLFFDAVQLDFATDTHTDPLLGKYRSGSYRVRGLLENPLELAALCCLTLPIALALMETASESVVKVLCATVAVLTGPVVWWTASRSGLIVLVFLLIGYLYRGLCLRLTIPVRVLVAGIAIGFAVMIYAMFSEEITWALVNTSDRHEMRSALSRIHQYIVAVPVLAESPWFGFGAARNIVKLIDVNHIDSYYLRTAMEGGLVALGLLIALLVSSFRMLLGARRVTTEMSARIVAGGLLVSLASVTVLMTVLNVPNNNFYVFLIIGLALALEKLAVEGDKLETNQPESSRYVRRAKQ